MFDVKKEIPSLEFCKKLKELGYPQKGGGWYYIEEKIGYRYGWNLVLIRDVHRAIDNYKIKAPTICEMEEVFPFEIIVEGNSKYSEICRLISYKNNEGWWYGYIPINCSLEEFIPIQIDYPDKEDWRIKFWGGTKPNACIKTFIWLIKNKYISFKGGNHDN